MKKIKRMMAIAIAIALSVATCGAFTAFAETLTINDERTGRTYVAYQIVTGDVSGTEADGYVLSNLKWGDGVTAALGTTGAALTQTQIDALPAKDANRETIENYYKGKLSETTHSSSAVQGGYDFGNLTPGWYVIKETTNTAGTDDFTSAFITEVVGNATATPKGSKTTVEKKVVDINDSTGDTNSTNPGKTADHDVGDTITYQLKATIGNDLTDYDTYKLVFTDNMSKGLTYKTVTGFTVDGESKDISNVVVSDGSYAALDNTSTAYTEGTVKVFTINDVISLGAKESSVIVITYTTELNSDAVKGVAGNPNKVYLEFSNNPDSDQLGKTPEDKNIVFTYDVVVNKIDKVTQKPLKGAAFTLYKVRSTFEVPTTGDAASKKSAIETAAIATISMTANTTNTAASGGDDNTGTVFTTSKGIDDGTYVLVETATPTGYNSIEPMKFVVDATHTDSTLTLDRLTGTGDITFTASSDKATLDANVENAKGTQLPSTGGMGTTIFYIIGVVLLAGAAIILVTKRRMNAE